MGIPDPATILSLSQSLKVSIDIVSGLVNVFKDKRNKEQLAELLSKLVAAHQGTFALQGELQTLNVEKSNLLKKIEQMEDWSREAERYLLREVGPGAFAMAPNPEIESVEPVHWLCANCFNDKMKSVLQRNPKLDHFNTDYYGCARCNSGIHVIDSNGHGPSYISGF